MVLKQVAEGLSVLHDCGSVHCSLSPTVVQVYRLNDQRDCTEIMVKLGEFDHATDERDSPLEGLVPPEVLESRADLWSQASDIWCFGVMIFSGKQKFIAASPLFDSTLSEGLFDGMIPPLAKPSLCPEEVWQLANKCMARQCTDRPTLTQVRGVLDHLLSCLHAKQAGKQEQDERRMEIMTVTSRPEAKRQQQSKGATAVPVTVQNHKIIHR